MSIPTKTELNLHKLNRYLSLQILAAIVMGTLCGVCFPKLSMGMQWVGTSFVTVIEPFVPPVIFLSIVSLFGSMENLRLAGRITIRALVYFILVSSTAIIFGICCGLLIKPGRIDRTFLETISPPKVEESNYHEWLNVVLQNSMLIILVLAIVIGLFINQYKYRNKVLVVIDRIKLILLKLLRYLFLLAPVITFCGIAYTVGRYGLETLVPIGKMLAGTYISMFLFVFTVLASLLAAFKVNIFVFLGTIKDELLYAMGTSSSSSVIPLLMEKLEGLGLKQPVVRLVTVTGNSLNLNGTCIYLGISVMFLAQLNNVSFTFSELCNIVLIILLTSKGASGIPGTGFLALVTTVSSIHKIPVEGLAVLLSIDRFMSEARAITNTIGHSVAALVVSKLKNSP
ncbi:aerobic C4-dicarboxylate transport protein [Pedobacter caeni]|uniref:Aerobic C4-dicarboxylate transport protein n=1 Tax=Pedobacter caeni TaxID=288992 RepID=A0A1M5BDJ6_9SPHI|nr:aerobic C4-dicarboxylate transport protein [Pedobacter caeni]